MSGWEAYVTNLIESNEGIKRGAIIGASDGGIWAKSQGGENEFKATDAELKTLAQAFKDVNAVPGTGIDLEGIHYVVPRVEENLIFGKKGKQGVVAAKTATAILVSVFEGETEVGSSALISTEKLAAYLSGSGY